MVPDVAEHARFFDHLVELVPPRFYYDDDARVNTRFLKKEAREELKADVKFKAKIAKLEKLDPDKAVTTLELQRRKAQGKADVNGADCLEPSGTGNTIAAAKPGKDGQAAGAPAATGLNLQLSGASMSRNELLERLHKKVEEARQRRKASEETAAKAKEWKQNALRGNVDGKQQQQQQGKQQQGKQQQQLAGSKRKGAAGEEPAAAGGKQAKPQAQGQGQGAKKARREDPTAAGGAGSGGEEQPDFKFARIEVEEGGRHGKAGRRPPKQVLLKQAEAKKAELEALADTEEGKAKAQQAAWKAALARASGEKVLDDPKLLRKSLKRESKLREKHGKAWQERMAAQQEAQAARQTKRKENLAARRQTKLDNKKAKREKKLLRPGFEGRKEGFIATGPAGGGSK
ncbi:hypothetical protein PLESTB_000091000 [Pleodorina starrii]|uniref:Surfeit locus protein 6 n=1 Tax=Pleodorina starrii TaxID=330485 RepID=A0A9W6BA76_9CHLO|nr:hypothetical protein PLESTM_000087300 [Pleodorina starrii]GLC48386.1 hypothetical protein PLESTB_000091000 [Pleodorina starrii]GLC76589.1 hypothetical protein PLESTF_001801200 [Pleodorina starrii]